MCIKELNALAQPFVFSIIDSILIKLFYFTAQSFNIYIAKEFKIRHNRRMRKYFFWSLAVVLSTVSVAIFTAGLLNLPQKQKTAVFVCSAPLSGPAKHLGIQYTNGIGAYFKYAATTGAFQNCKIIFEVYDDRYEPFLTAKNISSALLVNKEAFGVLGVVGTPTSEEAIKIAAKNDAPFLAPLSGANFLYDTKNAKNFTLRPSYTLEAEAMADFFVKTGISKIAVFYQNDGYGLSALKSIENAAKNKDIQIVAEGVYNRNTLSIKYAFNEIKKASPEAVVMAGTYKPAVEFAQKAQKNGVDWLFFNFSFTGLEPLEEEATKKLSRPDRLFIAQVTPPLFSKEPSIEEFKRIYAQVYPYEKPNSVAFEGFLVGKTISEALKNGGCDSKEKFISNLSNLKLKLTEESFLNYSKNDRNGLKKVYLMRLDGKGAKLVR